MTVEVRNRLSVKNSRLQVDKRRLRALAAQILELVGATARYNLGIVLVTDKQIAVLNAKYHQVQGPTDILSFHYGDSEGELVISLDHVRIQASHFHTSPARELMLYVIHGILHLHGYDDQTSRSRRRMHAAERRLMSHPTIKMRLQDVIVQSVKKRCAIRNRHLIA